MVDKKAGLDTSKLEAVQKQHQDTKPTLEDFTEMLSKKQQDRY